MTDPEAAAAVSHTAVSETPPSSAVLRCPRRVGEPARVLHNPSLNQRLGYRGWLRCETGAAGILHMETR
jgi:hypothetical protein